MKLFLVKMEFSEKEKKYIQKKIKIKIKSLSFNLRITYI